MLRNRLLKVGAGLLGIAVFVFGLLQAPTAKAAVVLNIQTPESGSVFNFCTNDFDTFTGVLHTLATQTFAGDGSVHTTIHVDNHDVKLTDPLLGDCEGQETLNTAVNNPAGVSTTQTVTVSLRMECSGAGGNQDATFTVPITVASDGTVTVGNPTLTAVDCR